MVKLDTKRFLLANPWRERKPFIEQWIKRDSLQEVKKWLSEPEILLILGARQVGKTTLLLQIIDLLLKKGIKLMDIFYFNLDIVGFGEYFEDPTAFIEFIEAQKKKKPFIFIDEVQRLKSPGIFLKALYDLKLGCKLIVSGSSSLELKSKLSEPLTGRKKIIKLSTLSFKEFFYWKNPEFKKIKLTKSNYQVYLSQLNRELFSYLTFGGYPRVVKLKNENKKIQTLQEIYSTYLEREVEAFLKIEKPETYTNLVKILAAQTGKLVNLNEITNTLGVNRLTVENYLFYLQKTFILSLVRPFYKNPRSEVSKMPKIYFHDLGLRNFALGVFNSFSNRFDKGEILENFVFLNLDSRFPKVNFWRTQTKAEVDFVVQDKGEIFSFEVKTSKGVLGKSLRNFLDYYKPKEAFIINLESWQKKEEVNFLPATIFALE